MKDTRVALFTQALDGLIESLEATIRVTEWAGNETLPEPLSEAARHLVQRLGTAGRLASSVFVGSPTDVARVTALCAQMRRLDTAYVTYRQHLETPSLRPGAAMTLTQEIDAVRASA